MKQYSYRSRVMHLILALIVLGLMGVGMSFNFISKEWENTAYMLHKSFGVIVLFLMFFRIFFILNDGRPALPKTVARWQKILARTIQGMLYILLFLMPLSGWLMASYSGYGVPFFNLTDLSIPGIVPDKQMTSLYVKLHYYFAWLIGGCLMLHIAGALKHWLYDKDGVFQSMWNFNQK